MNVGLFYTQLHTKFQVSIYKKLAKVCQSGLTLLTLNNIFEADPQELLVSEKTWMNINCKSSFEAATRQVSKFNIFRGNFPNSNPNLLWLTQPNLTRVKKF